MYAIHVWLVVSDFNMFNYFSKLLHNSIIYHKIKKYGDKHIYARHAKHKEMNWLYSDIKCHLSIDVDLFGYTTKTHYVLFNGLYQLGLIEKISKICQTTHKIQITEYVVCCITFDTMKPFW